MSPAALLSLVALSAALVNAQSLEPLASKTFTWPNIPYQVTGDNGGIRGPQLGFNLCNSTTENQQSLCQTAFLNNIADFCTWSSAQTNDTVAESEAREVAWCTSPGHGTRVIPPGAITGAQWLYAKDYLQVVGFIDQTQVGLNGLDQGGELDPHGADEQGNPLGGIVYTNGFGMHAADFNNVVTSGGNFTANQTYTQVIEWIDFIGGNMFCMKMCNPNNPDAPNLCNHIYDEVGCTYNALANYNAINNSFTVCDSDDMADPGFYTLPSGQTTQWHQPFSGPITPIPYTPTVPPSSNCFTYSSEQLFKAAATDTAAFPSLTAASAGATGSNGAQASGSGGASRSGSGSASPSQTGSSGSSSGALPAFSLGASTFVVASVLTTLITMTSMLA